MPNYQGFNEDAMLALLIGGRGVLEYHHRRAAYFDLCDAIEGDGPVVSCESQRLASAFLQRYGPRLTRRYAKALRR